MSVAVYEELLRFAVTKSDDPEVNDRKRRMVRVLVDTTPEVRDELLDKGELKGERAALRRVLARRGIALSAAEEARIEGCTDLETLLRWLDQALVAQDAAEALR